MIRKRRPLLERFLAKVTKQPGGCWLWTGCVDRDGYGQIRSGPAGTPQLKAHRAAHMLFKGPVPDFLHIDHLCRNPACVNPDHLEVVTPKENQARGLQGILLTHCKQGHPLSGDNLYLWRGGRCCRACRAERWRKTPAAVRRRAEAAASCSHPR